MPGGNHLLALWLGMTLALALVQIVRLRHRSGWEIPPDHPQEPVTRRTQRVWPMNSHFMVFTAPSSSPKASDTTSLCSAPQLNPHSLEFLNGMHVDMHVNWSLRQLLAPPALLPDRRDSRRILTLWTKVPVPPLEPSLHTAGPLPLQPGTLHSARCWRFTSARCCAPSERHVRVGMPDCGPRFQCANCLHPLRCSPDLLYLTQVSPMLLTPAASLACIRSGDTANGADAGAFFSPIIVFMRLVREGSHGAGFFG